MYMQWIFYLTDPTVSLNPIESVARVTGWQTSVTYHQRSITEHRPQRRHRPTHGIVTLNSTANASFTGSDINHLLKLHTNDKSQNKIILSLSSILH